MGTYQRPNILYLNVSKGKLVNKAQETSVDGYFGTFVKIESHEDEYEGNVVQKWRLTMSDPESSQQAAISFGQETYFALGFWARFEALNLSKPFLLGVIKSDQNEKISFCYLKQDDKVVKKREDFPGPQKVTHGKKEFLDWEPLHAEVEGIVLQIADRLVKDRAHAEAQAVVTEEQAADDEPPEEAPMGKDDDLPF